MIAKYTYGNPLNTDAVVMKMNPTVGKPEFFSVAKTEQGVTFTLQLAEEDIIFGLGQSSRGINKRGYRYRSWNIDEPRLVESRENLYGAHNFLLFFSASRLFGAYFDDPGEVLFDLGFTDRGQAKITSVQGSLNLYVITGDSLKGIARDFRRLTGRSYVPPRWGMGYIQSRWGYASEEDIRTVAAEHRKRKIPLDALCMDIDYMEEFKDFTWRKDAFPDMKGFTEEMKKDHLRLVPIIDAGIKQEQGYPVYDSGKAKDVFCKKQKAGDFTAAVWPGICCFPDFMKQESREWFGDQYRPLLDAGLEGFWNDMNEPALFYTKESLQEAYERAEKLKGNEKDYEGMWRTKEAYTNIANRREDYQRFFHRMDGNFVRHDRVHNLYGAFMTRATAEGFKRYNPTKRYLLFSRSSFIGAHRYGGIWQGDNSSWWSHLKLGLQMLPNLNLCGFLYTGCDLGGFGGDVTEDLLARFLQLGVFAPLMRNHSALHTRDQEIYRFGTWEQMRDTITVRYALLPWLYSEFMKSVLEDGMLFRPLAFDYPRDGRAIRVEDQLMLGENAMIAPILEQNATGRYVYLPEDMLYIRFRSAKDYDLEPLKKGAHYVSLKLNEFPLFVKKNTLLPLNAGAQSSEEIDDTAYTLLGWLTAEAKGRLYRDDGVSVNLDLDSHLTAISALPGQADAQGILRRSVTL